MIQRDQADQIIGVFNRDLLLLHAQGKYLDLPAMSESDALQLVREGALSDKEQFADAELIVELFPRWAERWIRKHRWSPQSRQKRRMVLLHYEGRSTRQIADELQCGETTVKRVIREWAPWRLASPEARARRNRVIRTRIAEGAPAGELARTFRLSLRQTYRILGQPAADRP